MWQNAKLVQLFAVLKNLQSGKNFDWFVRALWIHWTAWSEFTVCFLVLAELHCLSLLWAVHQNLRIYCTNLNENKLQNKHCIIFFNSCFISNINNFSNDFFIQFLNSFANFFSLNIEAYLVNLLIIIILFDNFTLFLILIWIDVDKFSTVYSCIESHWAEFFYYNVSKYFF